MLPIPPASGPLASRPPASRLEAERRSQLRGLLYLALLAALFVTLRYGPSHLFTPGWWRLW